MSAQIVQAWLKLQSSSSNQRLNSGNSVPLPKIGKLPELIATQFRTIRLVGPTHVTCITDMLPTSRYVRIQRQERKAKARGGEWCRSLWSAKFFRHMLSPNSYRSDTGKPLAALPLLSGQDGGFQRTSQQVIICCDAPAHPMAESSRCQPPPPFFSLVVCLLLLHPLLRLTLFLP